MAAPSLSARLKFLTIAGVGFFADGYLNLCIGLVIPMIGYIHFRDTKNVITLHKSDTIKGSLSLGMIVGQIGFGILGDTLGRHKVYGKELMLTMFGTFMCILLPWKGLSHDGIIAWLSVFRVVTGVGIGGDYPMSSSLSAETTPLGSRAVLVLSVFSCIGLGAFTSSIVYLILLAAFKDSIHQNINHLEWVWRLLLGLGIVPCALTLYARLRLKETKPYEKYVQDSHASEQESRGLKDQFRDFRHYFKEWKHAKVLFAVSACWFLFDIAYYGINLNQSVILAKIGYAKGATPYDTLHKTAVGNIIMQSAGYLPGFYIGIFLPDRLGRVRQQFYASVLVAILYAIWAGVIKAGASAGGLLTIFTISQLILNAGPNVTTFLLPVEVFPTRVRGTAHGIAAASGKCGAVLTAFSFGTVNQKIGLPGVLGIFSGVMALCAVCTLLIPETKGVTIDDVEKEVLYGDSNSSDRSVTDSSVSVEHVVGKDGLC